MRMLVGLFALLLLACDREDAPPKPEANIKGINAQYFIKWNYAYATGANLLANSIFEYQVNQPIKRAGSHLPILGGFDFNSYTTQVYDSIIKISSDKFLLQSQNNLPFAAPNPPKWEIEFRDNRPIKRVSYIHQSGVYLPRDTAVYYYNASNQVQKIEYYSTVQSASYLLTKIFKFDGGNLTQVTSVYLRRPSSILYSTEEYFDSYDNKANPLAKLWLWDDLYYRAISVNNFSAYTYKRFDALMNLTDSVRKNWTLQYDADGNIVFQ